MNNRHREQLQTRLTTSSVALYRFVLDKSSQARKIVQWTAIAPMLREAQALYCEVLDLQDGRPTADAAVRRLHRIPQLAALVGCLERDNRRKVMNQTIDGGKKAHRKKHYGFDFTAVAVIDEYCDDLIQQVCAYGQNHKPHNKG